MIKTLIGAVVIASLTTGVAVAAGPEVFIAHRGVGDALKYTIPENSLKAWKWVTANADPKFPPIYDLDAQVGKSGTFWVVHDTGDHALRRTTNGDGSVRNSSDSYIRDRWLEIPGKDVDGNDNDDNTTERVPTVDQALAYIATTGSKITLETKGSGWTQSRITALKGKLSKYGVLDRTIVHSFNLDHVSWAKIAGIPLRGYVAPSAGPAPSVTTIKKYGTYVFINYSVATASKMAEYKAAGIKACVWTMDTDGEYDRALALGDVYAWVVDDYLEALDYLQQAS